MLFLHAIFEVAYLQTQKSWNDRNQIKSPHIIDLKKSTAVLFLGSLSVLGEWDWDGEKKHLEMKENIPRHLQPL